MCVRTFVKQCAFMTGRDFSREFGRRGPKHIALEDCRHQIMYLVKARNHLMLGDPAGIYNANSQGDPVRPLGSGAPRKRHIPLPPLLPSAAGSGAPRKRHIPLPPLPPPGSGAPRKRHIPLPPLPPPAPGAPNKKHIPSPAIQPTDFPSASSSPQDHHLAKLNQQPTPESLHSRT
ncbi:hypothetical protein LOCC1_G004070 [Lachnellula occidentalis]|uniref:Uncharacterized protein n=1 Tax=Lachnellula occidentalis TaxID=215460 RepID=A0A8H8RV33_9HELO|nr:hypothetical protein LOCC1_G004070 [Lachnellula occidentalis]